ncbi:hypothetical protein Bbelb_080300 [Branchiostoma belcheri]|nr:hypothetical protein Bbelb_080300 [Branchiostoma belcheri]
MTLIPAMVLEALGDGLRASAQHSFSLASDHTHQGALRLLEVCRKFPCRWHCRVEESEESNSPEPETFLEISISASPELVHSLRSSIDKELEFNKYAYRWRPDIKVKDDYSRQDTISRVHEENSSSSDEGNTSSDEGPGNTSSDEGNTSSDEGNTSSDEGPGNTSSDEGPGNTSSDEGNTSSDEGPGNTRSSSDEVCDECGFLIFRRSEDLDEMHQNIRDNMYRQCFACGERNALYM